MQLSHTFRTASAIALSRPFVLFHKPTARCECRCRFCDFWVHQPKQDDWQPSEVVLALLDRARAAGMTTYTVWGGEPLVVTPLPAWLERARAIGMKTVVCTAGYSLEQRAAEIGPHLDSLLLSVEAVGDAQDTIRRTPGLFDRIVAGLGALRKHSKAPVTLWSNITRDTLDQIEAVAAFAADQRATVEYFPAARYPGYNESLLLEPAEREQAFSRVAELKRKGFPVLTSWHAIDLMRTGRSYHCNIPKFSVQVMADGTIHACEPRILPEVAPYGNVADLDLSALARSDAYRSTCKALSTCNRCLLPCVAAMADGIVAQSVRRALSLTHYG